MLMVLVMMRNFSGQSSCFGRESDSPISFFFFWGGGQMIPDFTLDFFPQMVETANRKVDFRY